MKTLLLGAVAYTPKVVSIWEGIRAYFHDAGCPLDFALFSNYKKFKASHYLVVKSSSASTL